MRRMPLTLPALFTLLCLLALLPAAQAQQALFSFPLQDTDIFTVEGSQRQITIYPLSELMKPHVQESRNRKVAAVSYNTDIVIRTDDAQNALSAILEQINTATGHKAGAFIDMPAANALRPDALLVAVAEKSVWQLLLTALNDGRYRLSVTCVIDE